MPTRIASCSCGQLQAVATAGDEGSKLEFNFCPTCGSTVYYFMEGLEEYIAIPVGAFADPSFAMPRVSVYEAHEHRWVVLPPDIEHVAWVRDGAEPLAQSEPRQLGGCTLPDMWVGRLTAAGQTLYPSSMRGT